MQMGNGGRRQCEGISDGRKKEQKHWATEREKKFHVSCIRLELRRSRQIQKGKRVEH